MLEFFSTDLRQLDPAVADLIGYEAERQARKIILIPSESQAPEAVREALGSVFQNIYAEGYPNPDTHGISETEILDYETQLARYRRFADARYYKGVEYADVVEALARRRAAVAFAANGVPPEQIWANVQPLSGSPANSAIYAALVAPGATVMGMDLLHGGHLTHGSPANRSGKLFKIVSYGIDPETERLNYDAIEKLARESKPKMIIAGYTSYPWMPDWARFRKIADAVGAYLLGRHLAHLRHGGRGRAAQPDRTCARHQLHDPQEPLRPARRVHPDDGQRAGRQDRLGRVPGRTGRPAHERHRRHGGGIQIGDHARIPGASAPGGGKRRAAGGRTREARDAHPSRRHRYAPAAAGLQERARGVRRQPGSQEGHAADGRCGRARSGSGRHRLQSQHHPGRQERPQPQRHPSGHAVDHAARIPGRARRAVGRHHRPPPQGDAAARVCRPARADLLSTGELRCAGRGETRRGGSRQRRGPGQGLRARRLPAPLLHAQTDDGSRRRLRSHPDPRPARARLPQRRHDQRRLRAGAG